MSPIKTGIAVALPTFMFLFAVGVLCSLFVTKRKNEIHPPNQKTLCGKMDLHDPNNPNYQNVSHYHIFGYGFKVVSFPTYENAHAKLKKRILLVRVWYHFE